MKRKVISKAVAAVSGTVARRRQETTAEHKAGEILSRFSEVYALEDLARRLVKLPLTPITVVIVVKGLVTVLRDRMDSAAKGQKSRQEKCPARQKCQVARQATTMLSTSATGRIVAGAKAASDITAM